MASSKPCSSWVLSLLAVMAVFNGGAVASTVFICTSQWYGVTPFDGRIEKVNLPCKYRLADVTCGDFRVKVTPGNALDADNNYSPVTVWVKVTNTVTMETVKLRTSQRLLEKVKAGELDHPWEIKDGSGSFLTFESSTGVDYKSNVYIGKSSILSFSKKKVYVDCEDPEFSSTGLPETLCGDGVTANGLEKAKTAAFGDRNLNFAEYLQYIILNDTTVTQSKSCAAVASDFQGCGKKYEAHIACNKYFNDPELVRCLVEQGTLPEDAYDYCLRKVCYGDDSNKPDLGNCE